MENRSYINRQTYIIDSNPSKNSKQQSYKDPLLIDWLRRIGKIIELSKSNNDVCLSFADPEKKSCEKKNSKVTKRN